MYKTFITSGTILVFLLGSLTSPNLFANDSSGVKFSMKYEGGSLPFKQHKKLKVWLKSDEIIFKQKKKEFVIPTNNVTELSYGNDVHRRVGQAVGLGLVSFGIGALMLLVKTKKHYVGVTWSEDQKKQHFSNKRIKPTQRSKVSPARGGVVFKVGKGEYRGFLKGLEGLTGLIAVNSEEASRGGTSKP